MPAVVASEVLVLHTHLIVEVEYRATHATKRPSEDLTSRPILQGKTQKLGTCVRGSRLFGWAVVYISKTSSRGENPIGEGRNVHRNRASTVKRVSAVLIFV